jgi:hypothetical protein
MAGSIKDDDDSLPHRPRSGIVRLAHSLETETGKEALTSLKRSVLRLFISEVVILLGVTCVGCGQALGERRLFFTGIIVTVVGCIYFAALRSHLRNRNRRLPE